MRFGQILMIAAMLAITGGHWVALQTVAWTTMLADNLRTGSLKEAVTQTFDGEHPCPICKQIAAGKKSEKKTEATFSAKKFEFASERTVFVFSPPNQFELLPYFDTRISGLISKPSVPPPRSLLG